MKSTEARENNKKAKIVSLDGSWRAENFILIKNHKFKSVERAANKSTRF